MATNGTRNARVAKAPWEHHTPHFAPKRSKVSDSQGPNCTSEDRGAEGLVLGSTIHENLALPGWRRRSRGGWADEPAALCATAEAIESLDIRPSDHRRIAGTLSGGNQQKIVLGKWLPLAPRALLLDEPTRGVDVGARLEIPGAGLDDVGGAVRQDEAAGRSAGWFG